MSWIQIEIGDNDFFEGPRTFIAAIIGYVKGREGEFTFEEWALDPTAFNIDSRKDGETFTKVTVGTVTKDGESKADNGPITLSFDATNEDGEFGGDITVLSCFPVEMVKPKAWVSVSV